MSATCDPVEAEFESTLAGAWAVRKLLGATVNIDE